MTIGIDLLTERGYQGTEVFAENLLLTLFRQHPSHTWVVFKGSEVLFQLDEYASHHPGIRIINLKHLRGTEGTVLQQQILLPFLSLRFRLNVLFSPSPFFSFFAPVAKINTIHDCAYARYPEFRNIWSAAYIKLCIFIGKFLCARTITVSKFSQSELVEIYHFQPKQLAIIEQGPPQFSPANKVDSKTVLNKFGIDSPFFLYIGVTRPRKNLERLLEVFSLFNQRHLGYKLVLAGNIDTTFINLAVIIEMLGLKDSVLQTGFVTNDEKQVLYKNSTALVFVSLYEGFGLPVLEAQALGVPVVTANSSSLPEVAGDGALLVDPNDVEAIVVAMEKVVFNADVRNRIVSRGSENIKRFSWIKTADQVMHILESGNHENTPSQ